MQNSLKISGSYRRRNHETLVEFEVQPGIENEIKPGYGDYMDPYWDGLITINEYSITEYSMETLKPTRYCVDFENESKWYDWN